MSNILTTEEIAHIDDAVLLDRTPPDYDTIRDWLLRALFTIEAMRSENGGYRQIEDDIVRSRVARLPDGARGRVIMRVELNGTPCDFIHRHQLLTLLGVKIGPEDFRKVYALKPFEWAELQFITQQDTSLSQEFDVALPLHVSAYGVPGILQMYWQRIADLNRFDLSTLRMHNHEAREVSAIPASIPSTPPSEAVGVTG